MDLNSNLPVLVPGIIGLIVVSIVAALALAWNKQPEIQKIIRRVWIGAAVLIVAGVLIFWLSSAFVPGRPAVDRSLQKEQQNELQQRLQGGGH